MSMKRRTRIGAALAAAAPLLAGCFAYVPADPGTIPAGQEVRVLLERGTEIELPDGVPPESEVLRGRLVRREDDRLTLRVPVGERRPGYSVELGQDVRIPTAQVLQIQRRELDLGRSALLVAGGAAVAGALLMVIMDDAGASSTSPQPGPGPEVIRVPLLSLPAR